MPAPRTSGCESNRYKMRSLFKVNLVLLKFCTVVFCLAAAAENPVLVGTWPGIPRGDALAVAVSGAHAYVAAGDGGLLVIDLTNPTAPVQVSSYLTSGEALAVVIAGNYAYVACGDAGLQVIDVSNPTAPVR